MGNKISSPLPSIQASTDAFSQDEFSSLRLKFGKCCNRGENVMNEKSFFRMLSSKYDSVFEQTLKIIFSIIDVKKRGFIGFDEFICAVALFRLGSDEDKAKFLFLIYCEPKTGNISRQSMQDLIVDMLISEQYIKGSSLSIGDMHAWAEAQRTITSDSMVECVFFQYGKEDDKISFPEFFSYVQAEESFKLFLIYLQSLFDVETS